MRLEMMVILLATLVPLLNANIILKPTKTADPQAAFVFIQGASIDAINYKTYALELQSKFNGSLWIALLEFPLNTPDPLQISSLMASAFGSLKAQGLNYDKNTPFFFGGHSLGGPVLQDFLIQNNGQFPFKFSGMILEGAFIRRKNIDAIYASSFPAVLTLGGELDGLSRITRMAESIYHDTVENKPNTFTIIVNGMNHYQFAGEGVPPPNVVKNDIQPEINNSIARDTITDLTNAFMNYVLNRQTKVDEELVASYKKSTMDLANPLIEAFKLEGFYHFVPPCSSDPDLKPPACLNGSSWSVSSQWQMGTLDPSHLNVTDTFRPAAKIPEHFPKLNNNCSTSSSSCVVSVSTFTENVYDMEDTFDIGINPIAATEIRTKMISRQVILQTYTNKKFDFNQTDTGSICGQINNNSITWALVNAPIASVKRYLNKGKQIVAGDDVGPLNNGFLWLNTHLKFEQKTDSKNRTYVEVDSPTLRLPSDYSIKIVAGLHYCKILSPARAIEWIYVDSLKP